jgi:hypothetical protein
VGSGRRTCSFQLWGLAGYILFSAASARTICHEAPCPPLLGAHNVHSGGVAVPWSNMTPLTRGRDHFPRILAVVAFQRTSSLQIRSSLLRNEEPRSPPVSNAEAVVSQLLDGTRFCGQEKPRKALEASPVTCSQSAARLKSLSCSSRINELHPSSLLTHKACPGLEISFQDRNHSSADRYSTVYLLGRYFSCSNLLPTSYPGSTP